MKEKTVKVAFRNSINPKARFDLLKIEKLFERKNLDHDIEKLHKVNFFLLLFITEGSSKHTVDFTDYEIKSGSILTIRKDQIQKFCKTSDLKGYLLMFTDDFLVSYLERQETQRSLQLFNELLSSPFLQLDETYFEIILSIIKRIESEYFAVTDEYSLSIIRSELHILISKLFRIKSTSKQTSLNKKYLAEFITFQELVEANVSNTNRVSDYADMMHISTKTLNTISKQILDKTAKEFIHEIHIKQIKRLLINTTLPIKEIAYQSGFIETTNFYKYFKRQVSKTPEQFRVQFS